ncbi:MAG: porin family protein [Endomicrobium sp.]|jgi:hypothetical protein|nr:porin family protein [Endomicrobium sp.]
MRKIVCSAVALLFFCAPLFAQVIGGDPYEFYMPDPDLNSSSSYSGSDSDSTASAAGSNSEERSEIVLKLEIAPAGQINTKNSISPGVSYDGAQIADNTGVYVAGEYYFYPLKFLGIGAGIKQQFERHIKHFGDLSISNFYLSIKPKFQLKPEAKGSKCKEFVYLIFQGGYGILNNEYKLEYGGAKITASSENGLYYAGGIGFQLNNFIFEIVFDVNESKIKANGSYSGTMDAMYTTTNINVGYRFGF